MSARSASWSMPLSVGLVRRKQLRLDASIVRPVSLIVTFGLEEKVDQAIPVVLVAACFDRRAGARLANTRPASTLVAYAMLSLGC